MNWKIIDDYNGVDYLELSGTLNFASGICELPIIFASPLFSINSDNSKFKVILSTETNPITTRDMECLIEIENDIKPTEIGFKLIDPGNEIKQSDKTIDLLLTRSGFSFGEVGVTWSINTRLNDQDFVDSQRVTFAPGELEKEISFSLSDRPITDKNGKYIFSASDLAGDAILDGDLFSLTVDVRHDIEWPIVEFSSPEISARQSDGDILIPVTRNITNKYMKVNWRENTEHEYGNDWRKEAGVLEFDELCGIKNVSLSWCQKPSLSQKTQIELELAGAADDEQFLLGDNRRCTVNIIQDVPFPKVSFSLPKIEVKQSEKILTVPVIRTGNLREEVSVEWAIKSEDGYYAGLEGDVFHLDDGQSEHVFKLKLSDKLAELPESQLTLVLITDLEKTKIGSNEHLDVIVANSGNQISWIHSS